MGPIGGAPSCANGAVQWARFHEESTPLSIDDQEMPATLYADHPRGRERRHAVEVDHVTVSIVATHRAVVIDRRGVSILRCFERQAVFHSPVALSHRWSW